MGATPADWYEMSDGLLYDSVLSTISLYLIIFTNSSEFMNRLQFVNIYRNALTIVRKCLHS